MKKLTLSALVVIASSSAVASAALAQDAAAGKTSFNKCLACHAVGEGAKNKVGPQLNGLDGRKSGTAPDFSYTDANKNSGITWNEAQFKEHQGSEGQNSRHQDGIRRHQERKRSQRLVGVPGAIRQGRKDQVTGLRRSVIATPFRQRAALACSTGSWFGRKGSV
jgi:cytochrome c2